MNKFARAIARLTELCRNAQVFEVIKLLVQVTFHLLEKLGERTYGQASDHVFLLVKIKWLLALA